MRRFAATLVMIGIAMAVGAGPAFSATRVVDDDKRQCPAAQYTTVQSAVDAAAPGDTVSVCDGNYAEDVQIGRNDDTPQDKSNLTVTSKSKGRATVEGFTVDGLEDSVSGADISRFRVQGIGIRLDDTGPVRILDNAIQDVDVGIDQGDLVGSTIRGNTIRGYTDAGVSVGVGGLGTGSVIDMRSNTLIGTPTSIGVRLETFSPGGFGPNVGGLVFGNSISHNGVAGIVESRADAEVKANNVFRNGVGLDVAAGGTTIANNKLNFNTDQGILVRTGGYRLSSNNARSNGGTDCEDRSSGSGTAGTGNTWSGNLGLESSPPGLCRKS